MYVEPVLQLELVRGRRPGPHHYLRYLYAGWLVLLLLPSAAAINARPGIAATFLGFFLAQQLCLIIFLTPILTAGAITEEKEKGTLGDLLLVGLKVPEIVAGKLLGRLSLLLPTVAAGWPVLFAMGALAGLSLWALTVILVQTALAALAIAAVSLLTSVWSRRTRDAVLLLYAVLGLAVAAWMLSVVGLLGMGWGWAEGLIHVLDPAWVWEPLWKSADPEPAGGRLVLHVLAWGTVALACAAVATWRLRPVYAKQVEGHAPPKDDPAWRREPVGDDPVLWRERHVVGLAAVPSLRFVPGDLVLAVVAIGAVITHVEALFSWPPPNRLFDRVYWAARWARLNLADAEWWIGGAGVIGSLAVALLAGIRAAETIPLEREKKTWESLVLTLLTPRQLVVPRFKGIAIAACPYLLAWGVPTVAIGGCIHWKLGVLAALGTLVGGAAVVMATAVGLVNATTSRTSGNALIGMAAVTASLGAVTFAGGAILGLPIGFFVYGIAWSLTPRPPPGQAGAEGPPQEIIFLASSVIGWAVAMVLATPAMVAEAVRRVRVQTTPRGEDPDD